MNIRNLIYNALGTIDCEIDHPDYGWIPFTASPYDVEPLGQEIHRRALAGEFGPIAAYQAPTKSPAEIIAEYESALDVHLDAVAKSYRFSDRTRLTLRAGYPNAWQALGIAFGTWMDDCNAQAYARLERAQAGQEAMPTVEQFLADLPAFVFPTP